MNEAWLVSLVALAGWLILMIGAVRAHRIGGRKMLAWGLTWAAIFLLVAAGFSLINAGSPGI